MSKKVLVESLKLSFFGVGDKVKLVCVSGLTVVRSPACSHSETVGRGFGPMLAGRWEPRGLHFMDSLSVGH